LFNLRRNKKTIFTVTIATALFLALSGFLPITRSQNSNNFTLPCTINTYGNAWSGDIAFDLEINSAFMGTGGTGNYFVVTDTSGNVIAVRQYDTSYGAAYNIAPYTLMFIGEPQVDGANTAPTYVTHFWNLSSGTVEDFPNVISHHDIQYDPINNTFLTLQNYVRNNSVLIDKIVQVDPNGNVIWSWDTYNHIPLSEASPFGETSSYNGQTLEDFTHSNTLDWHYNDSIIYLNVRNVNTFYKINQTTGNLIWACGEFGNFTLLGANGQPLVGANGLPPSLWYHCHDVKEVAPDVFTLFDNDYNNNTNQYDCHSRMVELTLNETSMTAYVNWSWEAPTAYWTPYAGANLLLPNGDYIGDFADPTHQNPAYPQNQPWDFTDTGAVFVEVNATGQVVRTFTFPVGCYAYRIETITNPSVITPIPTPVVFPTPTPVITPTPTPVITPSPTPVITPTPSVSPSSTPSINRQTIINSVVLAAVIVAVVVLAVLFYMRKRIGNHKN
jgi:hypothetical protein